MELLLFFNAFSEICSQRRFNLCQVTVSFSRLSSLADGGPRAWVAELNHSQVWRKGKGGEVGLRISSWKLADKNIQQQHHHFWLTHFSFHVACVLSACFETGSSLWPQTLGNPPGLASNVLGL